MDIGKLNKGAGAQKLLNKGKPPVLATTQVQFCKSTTQVHTFGARQLQNNRPPPHALLFSGSSSSSSKVFPELNQARTTVTQFEQATFFFKGGKKPASKLIRSAAAEEDFSSPSTSLGQSILKPFPIITHLPLWIFVQAAAAACFCRLLY